jgi:hypothetical protein
MVNRYFVNIEPIEPSGVVLTVEALPRLLIFGETTDDALRRACEAIGFQLRDASRSVDWPMVELVPRDIDETSELLTLASVGPGVDLF